MRLALLTSSSAWQQASRKTSRYEVRIVMAATTWPIGATTCVAGAVPLYQSSAASGPGTLSPIQEEILEFWFGRPGTAEYGSTRRAWFHKDASFDAALCESFGAALD